METMATMLKSGQGGVCEKRPSSAYTGPPTGMAPPESDGCARGALPRRPAHPPPFCLRDLRAAIPTHCFHKSAARSLAYVALDLALLAAAAAAAARIDSLTPPASLARAAAWVCYWCFSGVVGTGVWVCAHECGHGAFSNSPVLK